MAKKNSTTKYRVKPNKDVVSKIISAAALIVVGILMCIFKQQVIQWLMLILGIMLIVKGVLDFMSGLTVTGGVEIVLGILTLVFGFMAVQIAIIVLGIILALYGVSGLMYGGYRNLFTLVYCIVLIVGGVMLACNSSAAIDGIFIAVGVILIVEGVLSLFGKRIK